MNEKKIARAKPVKKSRLYFYLPQSPTELSYSYLILFSGLTVFLSRFLTDGPFPGVCFLIPAAIGYFLKWRKMPVLSAFLLAYLLFAPGFIPYSESSTLLFRLGHLDVMNMILICATLIYLQAQYRLYVIIDRAMPADRQDVKKNDPDLYLRQVKNIPVGEFRRLIFVSVLCVLISEFLWFFITEFYFEPSLTFPIRPSGQPFAEMLNHPGSVYPWLSRLTLTVFIFASFLAIARFAFWYWRLTALVQPEGQAVIADTGWAENRREYQRNEYWRNRALAGTNRETS